MSKTYYCVASSNKTGKVVADVIKCQSDSPPENRYYSELELYLDYFKTKATAEEFAGLMTNVIKKSPQGGNLKEDSTK